MAVTIRGTIPRFLKSRASWVLGGAKRVDQFTFEPSDPTATVSTPCSFLGTLLALLLVIAATVQQAELFVEHKATISRSILPRTHEFKVDVNRFGLSVFRSGAPVQNASLFHWSFRYRGIFFGDTRAESHPRANFELPAADCRVYFDVPQGAEPTPKGAALSTEAGTGKLAPMGCVDWPAAHQLLRKHGLSESVQLQGQYGEPAYWFLQASLMICDGNFSESTGEPCASKGEVRAFFKEKVSVDLAMLDGVSPGTWKWSNSYHNFDGETWLGVETFFQGLQHVEHHKILPSLVPKVGTTHLGFSSATARSTSVESMYVTFYFRLDSTVDRAEVSYFSLESAFEGVGAWQGFIFLIMGTVCHCYNRLVHECRAVPGQEAPSEKEWASELGAVEPGDEPKEVAERVVAE